MSGLREAISFPRAQPRASCDAARLVAPVIAARAATHDRAGSFAFENFDDLSCAGLLSLTVSKALGGDGASAADAAAVIGILAAADPSTSLVLSMHYIHHWVMTHQARWPAHIIRKLAHESVAGIALINALRVEPDLGSPSRGGLPATIARRTDTSWRLSGHKIYSTGAPILKYYAVWAATDEARPRVGLFLVPAGLPGTTIVETWDHLGLRASGSHDVVFDDVVFPLDQEIDVRSPEAWGVPDAGQSAFQSLMLAAIYDGVARSARDWLVTFLQTRVPANLGAPLATLPRMQEATGRIETLLSNNVRLIGSFAREIDGGVHPGVSESNILKLNVTNNAINAVEEALSLTGNHGLSRANPLERHYRDVLCGRVHTPQDDITTLVAGRRALGLQQNRAERSVSCRSNSSASSPPTIRRKRSCVRGRFSIRPTSRRSQRPMSWPALIARCLLFTRPFPTRCRSASMCSA